MSDFYHDDPIEDDLPRRRNYLGILGLVASLVCGGLYIQTTLAANVALNSGLPIEFGQGILATAACSGATSLSITPNKSFVNASGGGAFYLQGVTVSNIPNTCDGDDFTIKAYGASGNSPLALFNSTSTDAVVYQSSGAYSAGYGSTGMTVTSSSGSFTVNFTNPVATTSAAVKISIESGPHTAWAVVGQTGPGGGKVFYYNASGFACGPTLASTCRWLESAPVTWNGGAADPNLSWSNTANASNSVSGLTDAIGSGYKNSLAIQTQNGAFNSSTNSYGAGAALAYRGGGLSDWYLGSLQEIIAMKNASGTVGGLNNYMYMTSNQNSATNYIAYYIPWSQQFFPAKSTSPGEDRGVRPIRAF